MIRKLIRFILFLVVVASCIFIYKIVVERIHENKILREVIARLQADSRVAEILVTGVNFDEASQKTNTTIKFLEYDSKNRPLEPKYFTFSGNIIQFQSLVIRFDDIHVRQKDKLRGKSAYLFWKVFMLDGKNTQEYNISQPHQIPNGYKIDGARDEFEEKLWQDFWKYALDARHAESMGIKNAQIEAPGTMFIPGYLYTVKIEHDGGLRIDAKALSPILKGEQL